MPRPKAATIRTATPDRLLAAAAREFARHGYDTARLEDVARRAGITRPSLLFHFGSKAALYDAVVRRAFDRLGKALTAAAIRDGAFEDRLDGVVSAYVEFVDRNRDIAALLLREILDGRGPGRKMLLREAEPLIGWVTEFIRGEGGGRVPRDLDVRGAVLMIVTSTLVRAIAGPLRRPFWGATDSTRELARWIILGRDRARGADRDRARRAKASTKVPRASGGNT